MKNEITVGGHLVSLDHELLNFNENTLPSYLQREGAWYAYYGSVLADAECEEQWADAKADEKFDTLFWTLKADQAGSDKYCECRARSTAEVVEARQKTIMAKRNVTLLKQFLKALDKNHDNAQSTGHNLRKEMDKLGQAGERYGSQGLSDEERLEEFYSRKDLIA